MRDVTVVILNSLRIKCHIRRPLKISYAVSAPAERDASQLNYSYSIISLGVTRAGGGLISAVDPSPVNPRAPSPHPYPPPLPPPFPPHASTRPSLTQSTSDHRPLPPLPSPPVGGDLCDSMSDEFVVCRFFGCWSLVIGCRFVA